MSVERSFGVPPPAVRARRHAALGDPARLAIVDLLLLGDAAPSEVGRHVGLPSNLLAHHLHVLETVGLLARGRSEGDRRRSYLQLVPEALTGLTPSPVPPMDRRPPRVVFVCRHNSARSQLAAAEWARRSRVPVASAGTSPADRVHRGAVAVGRRHGLTVGRTPPRALGDVLRAGDLVVSVCDVTHEDLARARLPERHPHRYLHWSIADPVRIGTDAAFEAAYAAVADRVARLAAATTDLPAPREESS